MQVLRDYRAAGESRRKLLGLDAPVEVRATVDNSETVRAELDEMLARLDPPHSKKKKRRKPTVKAIAQLEDAAPMVE